jgi:SAM-dependent methyltransferase
MTAIQLICPRCGQGLEEDEEGLRCENCGAEYPIVGDVPILVTDLSEQHVSQRRYFDEEFDSYSSYALDNWRLSFIERIFSALGVLEGESPYLDVGVGGSGATVIEAARRGVAAVGCDLSVSGVRTAREFAIREGVEADFVVCAAEELPFPDASVGSASAVAVLEHLDDDRSALAELARVTKPGGRIWVTVPHAFRYIPPPLWPAFWWHDRRIGHKRHYDERRLRELGADIGLEHVATTFRGHLVKVAQFALSALAKSSRTRRGGLWWRLERRDRQAEARPWGAIQLNVVFRRAR